jgi:hypothetical protein
MSTALGHKLATWTQQTLRSFRLLIIMAVGPWKKKKEQPKIALYTGFVPVLTGLLVHVLPLAACIALIYLNITSYFVSIHVSTLAFQFLAKFLELLAQASLGSAVFVYLRALYTGPQSVPFGALFAGLQITSVSYLWSLEFAGVVTSKSFKPTRKFVFLLLIPLSVAIAVGIGPSIAIALSPTPGDFDGGWAVACINATDEQIFPSRLDPTISVYNFSNGCSTGDCARYGWETSINIAQLSRRSAKLGTQEGSLTLTQDALPFREIRWSFSMTGSAQYQMSATVTIPSKVIAWSLGKLAQQTSYMSSSWTDSWLAADYNITTTSRQPTVTVDCTAASWLNLTSVHVSGGNGVPQYVFRSELLRSFNETRSSNVTRSSNETQSFHWNFIDRDNAISEPSPQNNPSVWALIRYPPDTDSELGTLGFCAIYAGYAHVQNTVNYANGTENQGGILVSSQTNSPSDSNINIPAIWLNKTLPDSSVLLEYDLLGVDMATFLATSLAISMAQWPKQTLDYPNDDTWIGGFPKTSIILQPKRTGLDPFPNPLLKWRGSLADDHDFYPGSESAAKQGKYRLQLDVSYYGYSY